MAKFLFNGNLFDGRTSQITPAVLEYSNSHFRLSHPGGISEIPTTDVQISSRLGNTVRAFQLPNNGRFETTENDLADELVAELGRWSGASRFERSWRWVVGGIVTIVLIGYVSLFVVLPKVAKQAAPRLPKSIVMLISARIKKSILEELKPAKISVANELKLKHVKAHLREMFPYRKNEIVVVDMGKDEPNAFALPDSTILVTSELLRLLKIENQLMAVLLHEMGHVENYHFLRLLIQSSGVSLFLFATVGTSDVSSIPLLLMTQTYSREFETEADDFAAEYLKKMGSSPKELADALNQLQKAQPLSSKMPSFLSNHPLTDERIRRLNSL